jgi:hypothetical protein
MSTNYDCSYVRMPELLPWLRLPCATGQGFKRSELFQWLRLPVRMPELLPWLRLPCATGQGFKRLKHRC